jgi:GNAT superfamily N-acetyltransferase
MKPYDERNLDDPVLASLTGAHRTLAIRHGRAIRYRPDVSPFGAIREQTAEAWEDFAPLAAGGVALLDGPEPPADWTVSARFEVAQMVWNGDAVAHPVEVLELGDADVEDILELVAATHPGPFEGRTVELGRYIGVRADGRLVAMAGERMRPAGWTEVSGVCTAPDHQGRGLARALVGEIIRGIIAADSRPFLHVLADNPVAISLYESMGFEVRRTAMVTALRPPNSDATGDPA